MDSPKGTLSRRSFLRLAAAATAGSVLAACAPSSAAPQPASQATASGAQQPVASAVPQQPMNPTAVANLLNTNLALRIGDPGGQLKDLGMWDKVVQKFPNWNLTYEEAPFDQFMDKVLVELAGGTAPDMFLFNIELFQSWIDKPVFVPLNPYMDRDRIDWSRFTVDPRVGAGLNGVAYGLQQCLCDMPAIVYNKTAFKEAGLPLLPPPGAPGYDTWTWQDEINLAQALTKRRADGTVEQFGRLNPTAVDKGFEVYVWGNGGDILNTPWNYRNATECLIDRPEAIEAMQHIYDLTHKYKVTPAPEQAQESFGLDAFFAGRTAISQYYVQYDLLKEAPFEFGVYWTPSPKMKYGMHYNCNPRVIPTSTKNTDAAWEVLKYISFDPEMLRLHAARFRQPYDTYELINELTDPNAIETEKVVVSRLTPGDMSNQRPWHFGNRNGRKVHDVLNNTVQSILLNQVKLEDGLRQGKQEIDRLLKEAA